MLAAGLRELLEVLLQRGVGLLCGSEIARLQGLAELIEQLAELAATLKTVMMMCVQLRLSLIHI